MISLEEACDLALQEFKKYWGDSMKIKFIQETENIWIITPGTELDLYGPTPISIDKFTGKMDGYPTHEHFDVLRKLKKIKIPKKYR